MVRIEEENGSGCLKAEEKDETGCRVIVRL